MKAKLLCILIALLLLLSGCNAPAEEKETAAIDEYVTETPKEESGAEEDLAEDDIFSDAYKDYFVCRFEFLYKSTFLRFYDQKHYESLLGEGFTVKTLVKEKNDAGKKVYVVSAVTSSKEAFQAALCAIDEDNNVEMLTLEYSAHRIQKEEINPVLPEKPFEGSPRGDEFLYAREDYNKTQSGSYIQVTLKDMPIFSLNDFKELPLTFIVVNTVSTDPHAWIQMYSDEVLKKDGDKEKAALQQVNERIGSHLVFTDYWAIAEV